MKTWSEFIKEIENGALGRRYSDIELADAIGVSREVIYKLRVGITENPQQSTIDKLEKGLNIMISVYESDNMINYTIKKPAVKYEAPGNHKIEFNFIEYPVVATIPAGNADVNHFDWNDYERIDYDPRTHFWLIIDSEYGFSMTPFLQPGDRVLCSINAKIKDGDMVAVRWDKTKGAVKIWTENPELSEHIALTSYNSSEKPILLNRKRIDQVYKIILVKKNK